MWGLVFFFANASSSIFCTLVLFSGFYLTEVSFPLVDSGLESRKGRNSFEYFFGNVAEVDH